MNKTLALLALLSITGAAGFGLFHGLRHDDGFIIYQYARNIAEGQGFAFNPNQPSFGVSTPLMALILAAVYGLFGEVLPQASVLISCICIALQAYFLHLLLAPLSRPLAFCLSALVVCGFFGSYSLLALETNLFAALLLATIWAIESRGPLQGGLILGLAFVCRYDAALLGLVYAIFFLSKGDWRSLLKLFAASCVFTAPWLIFAGFYFGSALPQTFYSKQKLTPFWEYFSYAWQHIAAKPWSLLPESTKQPSILPWISLLLGLVGLGKIWKILPKLEPWILFSLLHSIAYAWMGPLKIQHWHMYPALFAANVLVCVGVFLCSVHLATRLKNRFVAAPSILLCVLCCLSSAKQVFHLSQSYPEQFWLGVRHARYSSIAAWMHAHLRPDQVFMANEIGTLGYLTRHTMIDPTGLIQPTNDFPKTHNLRSYAKLVKQYQPDIILVDSLTQASVLKVTCGYTTIHQFPWKEPWGILMVQSPSVLLQPDQFDALRSRLQIPDLVPLKFQ